MRASQKCNSFISGLGGFTLIEMLMVVAIIGILTAVAIPSYQASVTRGNRSVAVAALMDLANRQEQFRLNNKTYTADLSNLGYTAGLVYSLGGDSAIALDNNQGVVVSTSTERTYAIKIDSSAANSFSISAVPQLRQADDAECGTFTLTNGGARTESGTGTTSDCW